MPRACIQVLKGGRFRPKLLLLFSPDMSSTEHLATSHTTQVYTRSALPDVARLLTFLDRNPLSKTYGCLHRDYWLYKTSDFPDAVRQFGLHALAMAYAHPLPENPYHQSERLAAWIEAGLVYWASIQHHDGSMDEFYPNERGWVGPTAFTTFTSIEAFRLLESKMQPAARTAVLDAVARSAHFIAQGENEEDHLANHHAMACLALWKAHRLLNDDRLKTAMERAWETFLTYHRPEEGWSREYDGPDPGYLSATVSFLGKVYQDNPDPRIREVLDQSVFYCRYFVFPDGHYAGTLGSRNTLHFYPHGFELLKATNPDAAAVAKAMTTALDAGGQRVPPRHMSDRYLGYRVTEYLATAVDAGPDDAPVNLLPWEGPDFATYFSQSRVYARKEASTYLVSNVGKGGVLKAYDTEERKLLLCDGGWVGTLSGGGVITTQETDPTLEIVEDQEGVTLSGSFKLAPSQKLFTPQKLILFRLALLVVGFSTRACAWLKGVIRGMLIFKHKPVGLPFSRSISWDEHGPVITDIIGPTELGSMPERLLVGGEFHIRFVPQSRFFQVHELEVEPRELSPAELKVLSQGQRLERILRCGPNGQTLEHLNPVPPT